MSDALTRKGTWALIGAAVFAAGAAVVRLTAREPVVTLANAPPHDVVSRAIDSEMEVSPTLAAQRDGSLAVAWIATSGGREADTRYVGVRVSEPNAGKLGPLIRLPHDRPSDPSIVPLGSDGFLLAYLVNHEVYASRISRSGATAPVVVAKGASHPRLATTPSGAVLLAYEKTMAAGASIALATSLDGVTFTEHDVASQGADLLAVCGDDHVALVTAIDAKRTVSAHELPLDPAGPVSTSVVSGIGEHVAGTLPACFLSGPDAFVVYALTDKPQDPDESAIADALVFTRSKDGGKNFLQRVPYRPPTRVLHPTLTHQNNTFTLLGVMGSTVGDAHASASVIVLSADGRSQNGLTRTVIAPLTMTVAETAPGWMGDSLGLVDASGVTWTAVVDNASGESHVALVHVL